jgi:hypothetical protein
MKIFSITHKDACSLLGNHARFSMVTGIALREITYMLGFSFNKNWHNEGHVWVNLHLLVVTLRIRF